MLARAIGPSRRSMSRRPPLIAVVDDSESVHKALRRLLRSAGFDVETFSSGSTFLESMRSQAPDCLVLDLHMPDVSGFDVLAHVAGGAPAMPVVVITGHDSPESRSRVLREGGSAYLCKPIDDKLLLEAIGAAMDRRAHHASGPGAS